MADPADFQRMNTHRRLKPGEKYNAEKGDTFVAQADVHDVVRDQKETRKAVIQESFERSAEVGRSTDGPREVFERGFDAGEQHGHTVGFSRGAITTTKQLTHSKGANYRSLRTGNYIGEPETKLEAINQEQLTAEVCALLAGYAIVPTDLKVGAVIDALNTLPGVDLKFGPRPDPEEGKLL